EIIAAACLLLDQPDISDLAIERLRRHGEARMMDRVLALHDRPGFDQAHSRRAILRFALTFPQHPAAARYIAQRRAVDPDAVDAQEELLKIEDRDKTGKGEPGEK